MQLVDVHDVENQLSKWLAQMQEGEDIVIAQAGRPIARLAPYVPGKRKITPPGSMKGEIWIAEDFDEPLDHLFDCLSED